MKPQQQGFSLVELLICIAILSILLTISLPSMGAFTARQRVAAQIFEIQHASYLTRNLAITQEQV
ncbi:MAG TPA: prepilin-type N-terminal cleavage/methylation domain-containing protein [Porticoccaceae bacterium]|nr:prepilin-type N-terminal cleavage/methylation domain-containing protein [Porticoccaceae bacterium]HIK79313.1 prepilin-type N-terminal cleavage/methylation domain-containing protein [Porticoccaceae bacterium]